MAFYTSAEALTTKQQQNLIVESSFSVLTSRPPRHSAEGQSHAQGDDNENEPDAVNNTHKKSQITFLPKCVSHRWEKEEEALYSSSWWVSLPWQAFFGPAKRRYFV